MFSLRESDLIDLSSKVKIEQWVIALKGASSQQIDKVLASVSKRNAELLREELEAGEPIKKSDREDIREHIASLAKQSIDEGRYNDPQADDEWV